MVMHARKIPRLNDGYSDKHQTHNHGYENSKYSSKHRYTHEKSRDSPSTNSLRSSSPDSRSQSPRYHKSKILMSSNYYKIREKERDRENRDGKEYRDLDNNRSPIKDRRRERDKDHRESKAHDRVNAVHKKEDKEKFVRLGDWSEHMSSSGKKYYYNCRTEVSQWEKPPQWLDYDRSHRNAANTSQINITLKDSNIHRHEKIPDKHSNLGDGYREVRDSHRDVDRDKKDHKNNFNYERRTEAPRKLSQDVGTADMDISSGGSTPTSESQQQQRKPENNSECSASSSSQLAVNRSLSKLNECSLVPNSSQPSCSSLNSSLTVAAVPQLLGSHPRLNSLSSKGMGAQNSTNIYNNEDSALFKFSKNNVDSVANNYEGGPPTPTHSENETNDLRKLASTSLNSLSSLSQNLGNMPTLTPSLANYYNEKLISHVQDWPAETIEKQCMRNDEEMHALSNLIMTKSSTELKMARSLVRLAEIQSRLHEQRILYLRAQMEELDGVKTQNHFMNDT